MEDIAFTGKELEYIHDRDFLTAKFSVIDKLHKLFARTEERLKEEVKRSEFRFPEGAFTRAGKVSQGENYKNLPYMVLDYPRIFSKNDVFSFRVLFWWGHFFSVSLHLKGASLKKYRSILFENLHRTTDELYLCVNSTPWEYHFESDNYQALAAFDPSDLERIIKKKEFIKLGKKFELQQWRRLPELSVESFRRFLTYFTVNSL